MANSILYFKGKYCTACAAFLRTVADFAAGADLEVITYSITDPYGGAGVAKRHGIRHIPAAALVDESGKVLAKVEGAVSAEALARAFLPAAAEAEKPDENTEATAKPKRRSRAKKEGAADE